MNNSPTVNINWNRVILGGLVASIIVFVTDGLMHEKMLHNEWMAVYANLGARTPQPHSSSMVYFALFELGRGMLSIYLYALMRQCCGAGPKTAVFAGIVAWLAFSVTGPAQFIPLGFLSNSLWVKMMAIQLVTSVVATVAGAALYKESARA